MSRRPHLHVHHVDLFVRDQDRSLRFLTGQLGFRLLIDQPTEQVGRFVAVAPPDGTTILGLISPPPGSPQHEWIGRSSVVFVTDDVEALYAEWRGRGVAFAGPPQSTSWGGVVASLADPDGNALALMSHDALSRDLHDQERAAAERAEAERRAARELEIAREVQYRLLPQGPPPVRSLDCAGLCLQARRVGGDYYDFLPLGSERLGLVVADIAGKGIAAALLMANLQASLRGQAARALVDPQGFLEGLNRRFFGDT